MKLTTEHIERLKERLREVEIELLETRIWLERPFCIESFAEIDRFLAIKQIELIKKSLIDGEIDY